MIYPDAVSMFYGARHYYQTQGIMRIGKSILPVLLLFASSVSAQDKNFAVIELYTSEGCSSCPPAERLMPQLKEKWKDDLYVLEFHVDYWNRLGWKDEFSSSAYSDRQRSYTPVFKTNTVYTPQAIVNGTVHASGGNKKTVNTYVMQALVEKQQDRHISLSATQNSNKIQVTYKASMKPGEVMNIALVQNKATTDVKRGENAGKVLAHYNIVRDFSSHNDNAKTMTVQLPSGLSAGDCHIAAYIQNGKNKRIMDIITADIH